jgi:hypothetical protein
MHPPRTRQRRGHRLSLFPAFLPAVSLMAFALSATRLRVHDPLLTALHRFNNGGANPERTWSVPASQIYLEGHLTMELSNLLVVELVADLQRNPLACSIGPRPPLDFRCALPAKCGLLIGPAIQLIGSQKPGQWCSCFRAGQHARVRRYQARH